jgi:uncharacterized protein
MLFNPQVSGENQGGLLFYSIEGPGSMHAPLIVSLAAGLVIGFLASEKPFLHHGRYP